MTKEEAAADCWAITSKIGERFARSIMGKTIAMELEPDEMEAMVHASVDGFRAALLDAGGDPHDTEVAAQHVYIALVKEGSRIARTMTLEYGHA